MKAALFFNKDNLMVFDHGTRVQTFNGQSRDGEGDGKREFISLYFINLKFLNANLRTLFVKKQ